MKNNKKEFILILVMLLIVCSGYLIFFNNAFSGNEAQGRHIWLSASTVKFVNNWLKESPIKLNFMMYEYPPSIEFDSIAEAKVNNSRPTAYFSYPPGAVLPPYLIAKMLNKNEIQIVFIKKFLALKFLFDTLLVCFIIYGIFRVVLHLKLSNIIVIASVILSLSWMCIPINLYYLRNVYFSDQCIISIVLIFFLLETYRDYFLKSPFLKFLYLGLKFVLSIYGVLTDWYFLFVIFITFLVRVVPQIKKLNISKIIIISLFYILPVSIGLGLFVAQIISIPDYNKILFDIFKIRTFSNNEMNNIFIIIRNVLINYNLFCLLIPIMFYIILISIKNNAFRLKYNKLFTLMIIVYLPIVLHTLVFQQHSADHEFSLLKYSFPLILAIIVITFFVMDKKNVLDSKILIKIKNDSILPDIKIPLFYIVIILASVLFCGILNGNKYYYKLKIGNPISYERENLIRVNYSYNDVYFSFTESIVANPPYFLAISKKLIYKIDNLSEILNIFPNLNPDARILLIINKNNINKTKQILENELNAIENSNLLFSSDNYNVYEINRLLLFPSSP